MQLFNLKSWIAGAALAALAFIPSQALAIPVDLELSLVIDVSGSISGPEYLLQRTGYVNAFNDAGIRSNILSTANGQIGAIAVQVIHFSDTARQRIGWTLLNSDAAITNFTNIFSGLNRRPPAPRGTDIQDGMSLSFSSLRSSANNGYEGTRRVMDVSGDGTQNRSGNPSAVRNQAFRDGIVVNGLAIGNQNLANYFSNRVATSNGFVVRANSFQKFGDAVKEKIGKETAPVPEPGTVILFGTGLAGLAAWRMRKGKKA